MQIKPKTNCPLSGFAPCRQLECAWFVQLRGMHPQSGQEVDEWGCAVAWLPILQIETAREARQGAAATESFRNEVVAAQRARQQQLAADPAHMQGGRKKWP